MTDTLELIAAIACGFLVIVNLPRVARVVWFIVRVLAAIVGGAIYGVASVFHDRAVADPLWAASRCAALWISMMVVGAWWAA